jgi:serine/threonine-protein kinase
VLPSDFEFRISDFELEPMSEVNWTKLREEALQGVTLSTLPPTVTLPALPHAVTKFIERCKDERAGPKELAAIIETDAGLTIELLKHVNSSFVGLRSKAKTVQQALAVLGARQSKLLIIAAGTQAAIRARKSKMINQACFWNSCLQKAIFAREVAKLLKADADVAFAGALLQDYLLPVLTTDVFDVYARFTEQRASWPECLCDYEDQQFKWNHAVAGAMLALRWKLPDELVCCILFHHSGLKILADPQLGRSSAAAVAISALLPDQLRQHLTGLEQLAMLEEKWPAFDLAAVVEIVDREHVGHDLGVENDFPLSRRCQQILAARAQPATAP